MKIYFIGSVDGIVSAPFVLSAVVMCASVFILLVFLRDIIDSLLDSTALEIKYSSVSGYDKYSHIHFRKWRKKYYCKALAGIFLSAAAIASACLYMSEKL